MRRQLSGTTAGTRPDQWKPAGQDVIVITLLASLHTSWELGSVGNPSIFFLSDLYPNFILWCSRWNNGFIRNASGTQVFEIPLFGVNIKVNINKQYFILHSSLDSRVQQLLPNYEK